MTIDEAINAAWLAGCVSAAEGGRDSWNEQDRSACLAEYDRCMRVGKHGTSRVEVRIDQRGENDA